MLKKFTILAALLVTAAMAQSEAKADLRWHNLTKSNWQSMLDTFTPQGYRVVDFDIHVSNGQPRYFLHMRRTGGPAWRIRTGLNNYQLQNFSRTMTSQGYRLRKMRSYSVNGVLLHGALYTR